MQKVHKCFVIYRFLFEGIVYLLKIKKYNQDKVINMNLLLEIENRQKTKDETFSILGTEIKSQRLKNNMTLKETAENVCSVSYLCKIERNDINPNPFFIEKICDRVSINEEELKTLYNLSSLISNVEKAVYYDDGDEIDKAYLKVKELDNYKARLIKLIYFIYHNKKDEAICINNQLNQLTACMSTADLISFALFCAMVYKKCNELKDATEILKKVIKSPYASEYGLGIAMNMLLDIYYVTNSRRFLPIADRTMEFNTTHMNHKRYDYAMFLKAKHYLMNGIYDEFSLMIEKFKKSEYAQTIDLLNGAYNFKTRKPESYKGVSRFYYYIAMFFNNSKRFYLLDKDYQMLNDYEALYIKYLDLISKDDKDQFPIIMNELLPSALKMNATYLVGRLSELLVKKLCRDARYKQAYEILNKALNQMKAFDSL